MAANQHGFLPAVARQVLSACCCVKGRLVSSFAAGHAALSVPQHRLTPLRATGCTLFLSLCWCFWRLLLPVLHHGGGTNQCVAAACMNGTCVLCALTLVGQVHCGGYQWVQYCMCWMSMHTRCGWQSPRAKNNGQFCTLKLRPEPVQIAGLPVVGALWPWIGSGMQHHPGHVSLVQLKHHPSVTTTLAGPTPWAVMAPAACRRLACQTTTSAQAACHKTPQHAWMV